MIPKIIHYCWFGNKKIPKEFQTYIEDWKRLCPDYEIKKWTEENFPYKKSVYAAQAYRAQKWAFVTDYARFRILYEYGGIYLDTDVELIKPLDTLLETCETENIRGFMGIERPETGDVAPGLICAAEPKNLLIKELLMCYKGRKFIDDNGQQDLTTVVEYTNKILKNHGFGNTESPADITGKNTITDIENSQFRIYPSDYFNPMDMNTGEIHITDNTYSIHHYASSWVDGYSRLRGKIYKGIRRKLGEKTANNLQKMLGR